VEPGTFIRTFDLGDLSGSGLHGSPPELTSAGTANST
jgi:hypothetical protein